MNFTSLFFFFKWNIHFGIQKGDWHDYEASRLNSGTQSGPEINRKSSGMSKNDDNRILKMWLQVIDKKKKKIYSKAKLSQLVHYHFSMIIIFNF